MTPDQIRNRLKAIAKLDFGIPNTAILVANEPDHRIARVALRVGRARTGHSDAAKAWRALAEDIRRNND